MNKKLISLCTLFCLCIFALSAGAHPKNKSAKQTITVKTKIFCDHCAKCESCKERVENKVYELKGIRTVEMDTKKETILVIFNPKFINEQKIREQIAAAGFDADDVKATQEQIAGLDACCKKQ